VLQSRLVKPAPKRFHKLIIENPGGTTARHGRSFPACG
jgi:hypothetical protein